MSYLKNKDPESMFTILVNELDGKVDIQTEVFRCKQH